MCRRMQLRRNAIYALALIIYTLVIRYLFYFPAAVIGSAPAAAAPLPSSPALSAQDADRSAQSKELLVRATAKHSDDARTIDALHAERDQLTRHVQSCETGLREMRRRLTELLESHTNTPPPPPPPPPPPTALPTPPAGGGGGDVGRHGIISLCENPARYMTIFLGSLRRTGSAAEVICFHFQLPLNDELQRTYDAYGPVTVVKFDVPKDYHPVHYRMTAYVEWLQSRPAQYSKLLLVDSLDMAFQTDPFALFDQNTLLETLKTNHTICKSNREWVIDCFGQSEYNKMAATPILNSGLIGGPPHLILPLITRMAKEVDRSRKCSDQGALNWLYHTGHLSTASSPPPATAPGAAVDVFTALPAAQSRTARVRVVDVETGPVLHTLEKVCTEAAHESGRDLFGRLKNLRRTETAAVVHQWTRCPALVSHFFALYPFTGKWKYPGVFEK